MSAPHLTPAGDVPQAQAQPPANGSVHGGGRFGILRPDAVQRTIAIVLLAAILIWEAASRVGIVDPLFVSRPSAIFAVLPELMGDARVRDALTITGLTMLRAFVLGTALGIVLGYAMGFVPLLRDAFYGPALFLLSVPKSIFIPIFMVLFGIGVRSAVFYGAFSAFIYVVINVTNGFDLIEARHKTLAVAYGANLRHLIMHVSLPASMPGVFTGIWYGIKNGMQGVLIYELFVSMGGVGQLINLYANRLETSRIYALILGISVIAVLAGSTWTLVEKRLSRWRPDALLVSGSTSARE